MNIINKSKITKILNFNLKLIVLSSLIFSQLSLSEIFLYQNNPDTSSINIAEANTSDTWYNTSYLYRKEITINSAKVPNTNQTNFPVLISLTDTALRTVANGGKVTNVSGYDIIFANQAGNAKLDYEIESYDAATGTIVMWVKIPVLSYQNNTVIYIYYGNVGISTTQENKTGVWDDGTNNNYKGVWHLKEDPSLAFPQMADSSGNGNGLTSVGTMTSADSVVGKIGKALIFGRVNDFLVKSNNSSLNFATQFTISFWVNSVFSGYYELAGKTRSGGGAIDHHYLLESSIADLAFTIGNDAGSQDSLVKTGFFTGYTNTWVHVTATYNNGAMKLYRNGVSQASKTSAITSLKTTSNNFEIGRFPNYPTDYLRGSMDEVSVSNVERSVDWIKTGYNNQSSPTPAAGNFILPLGTEESYATNYDLTPPSPSSGPINTPSQNFTITPNGIYTGTITISSSGGGLSDAITKTFTNSSTPQTFTITPTAGGTVTLTMTNSGSLTNPSPATYSSISISASPSNIIQSSTNNTIDVTGINTSWIAGAPGAPTFTLSGGTGASITSQTITDPTHAILTINAGSAAGALSVTYASGPTATVSVVPSTTSQMISFNLDTPSTIGTIDNINHTVALTVPYSTNVTNLIPTITVSTNATINPLSNTAQNFTSPVTYRVTAQDGITYQDYIVTVTIAPNIQFTATTSSASEGITTANIGLTLSKTWASDVTVNYAVTGGTATNSGTDYTLASGTATITAGATTTNIPINITDDSLYEQNETIQLTISSPTNATLGTNTIHTFTIQENDSAPSVTLSKSAATLSENNGTATITATLSNPSYQDVTINLTFSGTATNVTNYTRSADSIIIPAGSTTNSITLTGVNNNTYETPDKTIITDISTVTNGTKDSGSLIQTIIINEDTVPSTANLITSFNLDTPSTIGITNDTNHTVILTVPYNTNVIHLTPTITVSTDATISPVTGTPQDFTNPVTYTITAQDGTPQTYTVTVTVASNTVVGNSILPTKPIILLNNNQRIDISTLPQNINQIAISRTPDFKDISWEAFNKDEFIELDKTKETLYIKFRTKNGSTSDVFTYVPETSNLSNLQDGDIVKTVNNPDIYIIKMKNNKQYKRLILSPSVFQSYGHLKWSNLKILSQEELDQYTTADLVKETTDTTIYELFPNGDIGERRAFDVSKSYDADSVYEINITDRDSYRLVR